MKLQYATESFGDVQLILAAHEIWAFSIIQQNGRWKKQRIEWIVCVGTQTIHKIVCEL